MGKMIMVVSMRWSEIRGIESRRCPLISSFGRHTREASLGKAPSRISDGVCNSLQINESNSLQDYLSNCHFRGIDPLDVYS